MVKNNLRIFTLAIILSLIASIWIFNFQNRNAQTQKTVQIENQPALLLEATPTAISEPICDNYQEIEQFERPIPIIWTAKLTGCLVSCRGAHFTRLPEEENYKHPRFSAYYPDASGRYAWDEKYQDAGRIPEKFLQDDLILKIYGNWTDITFGHPYTVFENKCVPLVEIEKIEIEK